MEEYVLAIDIGTSGIKAGIFDSKGNLDSIAKLEIPILSPYPGSSVQRLEEIYNLVIEACKHVVKQSKRKIEAISLSSQMHGIAAIGKDGKELVPLMTYLDTRPSSIMDHITKSVDPYELYKETGCPPSFIYPLSKIVWIGKEREKEFREARWFLSVKDYIMFRIFGEPYLDKSVASGSQLLNIKSLNWSETALRLAGIDESKLPFLYDGEKVFDKLPKGFSKEIGLGEETKIILGASDGALHSVGVGAVEEGILALNLGTSGAIRSISREVVVDRSKAMRFFCYYVGYGFRLPGGAINNAGIVLRWFKLNFGQIEEIMAKIMNDDAYSIITREADKAKPTSDGLIFLPFLSGERFPINNPYAKGIIFGLSLGHERSHIIRAIMEGSIYTLRWIYEAMLENGIDGVKIRTGGGGSKSFLWRQIQADIFGIPVEMPVVEEASLLGAAAMGFVALGRYSSLNDAIKNMVKVGSINYPNFENHRLYSRFFDFYKKLYYTLENLYLEHSKIIEQYF